LKRAAVLVCALTTARAGASELAVSHAAIERLLVTKVLTQGGRLYLDGSPGDSCRFAFVQEPKVSGDNGRLQVRFVFSGRAGVQVAGRCAGPGDTLSLTASGVPTYVDGELRLAELRVEAPASTYFKAVAGLVQGQIERRVRFPVRNQLASAVQDASLGTPLRLTLTGFDVRSIAVDERGLRFGFDGSLNAQ
jgi:hypothetical protein